MNILLFDLENGSKTLGGKEAIQKEFKLPVLTPGTFQQFQETLGQLYVEETVNEKVMVAGLSIDQPTKKIGLRGGLGDKIDAVVIDTVSELSKKYQRSLLNKQGVMQLQSWGQLRNKLDGMLEYVTRLPGIVICNCHGKIQTMDTGENKILPYIDGSTKEDISKWFDFVFYTKTIISGKETKYMWVTSHTSTHDHAKDRTQLLAPEIEQDYKQVIKVAIEKGFDGEKILVIGSPGTGKTLSLRTLTS